MNSLVYYMVYYVVTFLKNMYSSTVVSFKMVANINERLLIYDNIIHSNKYCNFCWATSNPPIHLYTYTPIHLYTYTPIHLYTYPFIHITTCYLASLVITCSINTFQKIETKQMTLTQLIVTQYYVQNGNQD